MMDLEFYRERVFEIILGGLHIPRENCEVLEPFPSCFSDFDTKQRRYDDLKLCINSIPDLNEINDKTSLPEFAWELLYWIFTNPLRISVVKESEVSEYLTNMLREETKLMSIPYPDQFCNRFKINHPSEMNSTKLFLQHKVTFGSFFAYHGSPGYNFHSIIHRGLRCSLNKRSAYGPGTYVTSFLNTATQYSSHYGSDGGRITYCVAIVEVIKHPSIKVFHFGGISGSGGQPLENFNFEDTSSNQHRYYVVNSDDLMRLKHLLVYY